MCTGFFTPIKRILVNTESHWQLPFSEYQLYYRHIITFFSRLAVALEYNIYHFTDDKAEFQRDWMICPLHILPATSYQLRSGGLWWHWTFPCTPHHWHWWHPHCISESLHFSLKFIFKIIIYLLIKDSDWAKFLLLFLSFPRIFCTQRELLDGTLAISHFLCSCFILLEFPSVSTWSNLTFLMIQLKYYSFHIAFSNTST